MQKRPIFAASLSSTLNPGGKYLMLCFSEHEPGSYGPRRVTQAEIRATFSKGWKINYIREAELETTFGTGGVKSLAVLNHSSVDYIILCKKYT